MVEDAYKSLSSEYAKLKSNPYQRLKDYYNYTSKGLDALWDFSQVLGKMIIDPDFSTSLIREIFGEFGSFIAETFEQISNLPLSSKVNIICSILASIGTDSLAALLTAGAMSGKLLLSLKGLVSKVSKIISLINRGAKFGVKPMLNLSEEMIRKLDKILLAKKENYPN